MLIDKVRNTLMTADENLSAKYKVSESIHAFEELLTQLSNEPVSPQKDVHLDVVEDTEQIKVLNERIHHLEEEINILRTGMSITETFCKTLLAKPRMSGEKNQTKKIKNQV